MTLLDWVILITTIGFIVGYGIWKTRGARDATGYLRGGNEARWPTIGLSIMATQASAITFLSMPGKAYEDGLRFVQFYFGMPLAVIFICVFLVPIYYRLEVFTAYEYLESRFDRRTRQLGALFFLLQRGLQAGISIYAPAIILSALFDWSLTLMTIMIGVLVIAYTVSGGTKAVSQTQKQQMIVIMLGMVITATILIQQVTEQVSFHEALSIAGALGRMETVDFTFDLHNRYTVWTGILGGFFLALSYFGTDQSQVQRYLSGRSLTESRLGLIFNGLLKVPMQFFILMIGVFLFVFYVLNPAPATFNRPAYTQALETPAQEQLIVLDEEHTRLDHIRKQQALSYVHVLRKGENSEISDAKRTLQDAHQNVARIRSEVRQAVSQAVPKTPLQDYDYIFLHFVLACLPAGLIGLLVAVILSAAMSSTASELNALGTTMSVDFYKTSWRPQATDRQMVRASKGYTILWGILAISFALLTSLFDNLIELINILGSLFYGTVLGVFLVGFFVAFVRAKAVFWAALLSEACVLTLYIGGRAGYVPEIGYLWFNVIGCFLVILFGTVLQLFNQRTQAYRH